MTKILVVDDDIGTRETFAMILNDARMHASTAATGREAIAILEASGCDGIIADLRLPDMSGIELLRQLTGAGITVPFALMTAFGTIDSAIEATRLGAVDYVEKPLSISQVVSLAGRLSHRSVTLPSCRSDDIHDIIASARPPETTHSSDPRVDRALQMIRDGFSDAELTLGTIADGLRVSVEHLCRLLKRDTGAGFRFHLHQTRTAEAKRLLLETNLAVKEIAFRTGYSPARLEHHFRRFFGTLPTSFRHGKHTVHGQAPIKSA